MIPVKQLPSTSTKAPKYHSRSSVQETKSVATSIKFMLFSNSLCTCKSEQSSSRVPSQILVQLACTPILLPKNTSNRQLLRPLHETVAYQLPGVCVDIESPNARIHMVGVAYLAGHG